uniref:Uncharacterized protein n=1 Tax=Solanum tuberosum TaxID=4113 RepID=M1B085_SOLTU
MIQFKEDERLIQFLMELNETYSQARSNILMLKPLPSVNHAYSLLLQDENQLEIHHLQFPGDGSSFIVGSQVHSGNSYSRVQSTPQQRSGHTNFKGNNTYKVKERVILYLLQAH